MTEGKIRAYETTIEIDAPPDVVWRALTDPTELTRWFPLQASVAPGVDGSVLYSWGGAWEWKNRIRFWEPGRRLQLVNAQSAAYDAEGKPLPSAGPPVEVALDYQLEARGGRTVLRLVHSGFGTGAEWDDEVEGISNGWPFELRSLKHYLERHRARRRSVAWARVNAPTSVAEAWTRLIGREGLALEGVVAARREGGPYAVPSANGDSFEGAVLIVAPPRAFAGTLAPLNDGLFRASVERAAGQTSVHLWASGWSVEPGAVQALERRMASLLERLFGAPATIAGASSD